MLGCVQAGSTAGGAGTAACVDGCLTSLGRELSRTWRRVQHKGVLPRGCSAAEWSMCESMLYMPPSLRHVQCSMLRRTSPKNYWASLHSVAASG